MAAIGAHVPHGTLPRPSSYPFVKVVLHTRLGNLVAVPEGDPYIERALSDGAVIVRRGEVFRPGFGRELPLDDAAALAEQAVRIRARAAVAREIAAEQAEWSGKRRVARRAAAVARRAEQAAARDRAGTSRRVCRAIRRDRPARVPGVIRALDRFFGRA